MGCLTSVAKKIFMALLSLVKVAIAVIIIVVVTKRLYTVDFNRSGTTIDSTATCLMSTDIGSSSICGYAYAVAGLSIIISGLIALFLCCTCNLCGLGNIIELLLAICGTGWWVAAAIVFGRYGKEANDVDVPQEQARNAVIILAWVQVAAFGLTALVILVSAINCLRKCLCCCCEDDVEK